MTEQGGNVKIPVTRLKAQRWNDLHCVGTKRHAQWQFASLAILKSQTKWHEIHHVSVISQCLFLVCEFVFTTTGLEWFVLEKVKIENETNYSQRQVIGISSIAKRLFAFKLTNPVGISAVVQFKESIRIRGCVLFLSCLKSRSKVVSVVLINRRLVSKSNVVVWNTLEHPFVGIAYWSIFELKSLKAETNWNVVGSILVERSAIWNVVHLGKKIQTNWNVSESVGIVDSSIYNNRVTVSNISFSLWNVYKISVIKVIIRYKVLETIKFVEPKIVKLPSLGGAYLSITTLNSLDKKQRLKLGIK